MKSIYDLVPLDVSGRYARNGFVYQDHVGASFCLEMLIRNDLEEIWFETHDDITLLWRSASGVRVEFVQVKAHDLLSRWSVPVITYRDTGNGSSLLEKSLLQHRCQEEATFRIVTSYDVNSDLSPLKHQINSPTRLSEIDELAELTKKIQGRYNGDVIQSESGKDIKYWVDNCLWEKRSDKVDDLENANRLILEQVFKSKNRFVIAEHRDEMYKKLLALVMEASSKDILVHATCHKLTRTQTEKWFEDQLSSLTNYGNSDNPLRDKMQKAELPDPLVQVAQDLRWRYTEARLEPDYYGPNALKLLEDEVMSLIPQLQIEQYSQGESFNSLSFHSFCIKELYKVLEKDKLKGFPLQGSLATGFFYQVANRCLMRFTV